MLTIIYICTKQSSIFTVRRSLADAEKAVQESKVEQDALSKRLKDASKKIRSLEAKLEKEDKESSESILVNQRLAEELADERKQHQKALEERDFNADQIRKKYQST
jgi:septal ring factor EnvC (AmiA/AmiB activator)